MPMLKNPYRGTVALLFATLIYGFYGVLSRYVSFNIDLFYQTAVRGLLAIVAYSLLIVVQRGWKSIERSDWKWLIPRGLSGLIAIVTIFIAFNFIPLGTAYLTYYASSTITGYLLGQFLFNESLNRIKVFSLITSLIGLFMIYSIVIITKNELYLMLSIISGVTGSLWNILSKKVSTKYSVTQLSLVDTIISFSAAIIVSLSLRENWQTPTLTLPWIMNFIFAFGWISGGLLIVYGFKQLEAQIGSLIMLTEVIFAILLGYIFFKEIPSARTVLGGILITGSIALSEFYGNSSKKS